MNNHTIKIIYTGLLAGFVSEGFLGAVFMSTPIQNILYNPQWQSKLFLEITPMRDFVPSVVGLVVLTVIHSWLFTIFQQSMPGENWKLTIWLM